MKMIFNPERFLEWVIVSPEDALSKISPTLKLRPLYYISCVVLVESIFFMQEAVNQSQAVHLSLYC